MKQIIPKKPAGAGETSGKSQFPETKYISMKKSVDGFEYRGKFRTSKSKVVDGKTQLTHYFDNEDGTATGINGTEQLNDCLAQIPAGTPVLVRKVGTSKTAKGFTLINVEVYDLSDEAPAPAKAANGFPFA